jgi:hypothetical protein
MINTLFDLLCFNITRTDSKIITFITNNSNRTNLLSACFNEILELYDYKYILINDNDIHVNDNFFNDIKYIVADCINMDDRDINKLLSDLKKHNKKIILLTKIDSFNDMSDLVIREDNKYNLKVIKNNYGELFDLIDC